MTTSQNPVRDTLKASWKWALALLIAFATGAGYAAGTLRAQELRGATSGFVFQQSFLQGFAWFVAACGAFIALAAALVWITDGLTWLRARTGERQLSKSAH